MSKSVRFDLKKTCEFLSAHDNYLILTHAMPDGDTLGSSYALCAGLLKMGKQARVICGDPIPSQYGYFTDNVIFPEFEESTVISVDVADEKLLGALREQYASRVMLAIDHHVSHRDFAQNLFLDGTASAACECVYDILSALHIEIDSIMASALYTGIATDTGCFKFSSTTPKTHIIAADLMVRDVDFSEINRIMFDTKSRSRTELEKRAIGKMKLYFDGACAIMPVTRNMMKASGCSDADIEGITAIPRSVEGVLIGVTLRQREGMRWKVSMRSYPPVNVSEICAEMQGGGHAYAAGCEVYGTLREAKAEILKHVKKALEKISAGNNSSK